ncbi:hypothetical protein DERF_003743 [Dermatophagoides farinae]|uniref:Uncharacterized protein n=1 Tax=Dermatophagoides farinae TaxID=6954 RepID=A0A922LAW1_DERFA|nr:hypothetical protein DERF_003743 [Dermatophagoides farinae]
MNNCDIVVLEKIDRKLACWVADLIPIFVSAHIFAYQSIDCQSIFYRFLFFNIMFSNIDLFSSKWDGDLEEKSN